MRILEGLYSSGQGEPTNACDSTAGNHVGVEYTGAVASWRECNCIHCPYARGLRVQRGAQSRETNQMTQAVLKVKKRRQPAEDTWYAQVWRQAGSLREGKGSPPGRGPESYKGCGLCSQTPGFAPNKLRDLEQSALTF